MNSIITILTTLLIKSLAQVIIVYDQKNDTIQQTANTITFNITATFPTSSDVQVDVQLPSQIIGQENIVCGVTGLTNGACNLVYSKFIITFKSATPTFQIIFINVNNPITTYTDQVQLNASVIATKSVIFTKLVQLKFQFKNVPLSIIQPPTTYIAAPLTITIDGTSITFPTQSQIIITTNGVIDNLVKLTGIVFESIKLQDSTIIINNVQLPSNAKSTFSISKFIIKSNEPINYKVEILDSNNGQITMFQTSQTVQTINNNYDYTLSAENQVVGMPTSIKIILCNLDEQSKFIFTSSIAKLNYVTSYESSCHSTLIQQFTNPFSLNSISFDLQVTLNNFNSIKRSISYTPIKDQISMTLTQNTTIMLNYALVILSLQLNQQYSNFFIELANSYTTDSCKIQDVDCSQMNNIYKSNLLEQKLNKVIIKLEILLPGCDSYYFQAKLIYQNQELATSNQITPLLVKYKLTSTLSTSSFNIGEESVFTINGLDSKQITKYYVSTTLTDLKCQDCIQNENQLQYGQVNSIQFSANNLKNVKPYTITIIAYNDQCLIAEQIFRQQAIAQKLQLSVITDNNYQQAQGNWQITISPDIQDKGIMKTPFILPNNQENKINATSMYINQTKYTLNMINWYFDKEENYWEVGYYREGYLYAYGNLTLPQLNIMDFKNLKITKQNAQINETDKVIITFDTYFDIPVDGQLQLDVTDVQLSNLTLNGVEINNQVVIPKGNQVLNFQISFMNPISNYSKQFTLTSFNELGRILQKSNFQYAFNYGCSIEQCGVCNLTDCISCKSTFTLVNNTCQLICEENQNIVNNTCVNNQNNNTHNVNDTNTTTPNKTGDITIQHDEDSFVFTPPIISPIVVLIYLFALSRKCWSSESETFIIFYSLASVMEHIIHIFLFIYFFVTLDLIYGFCMISVIVLHFSSQIYIVFMNLFKIDPEYIGIRQQNNWLKLLHIISLTFCGRLLLLLISKFDQSYVWSTPWTFKISVLQRLSNYLKFQIIAQIGVLTLVILAILQKLFLLYIEILSFQIIQTVVTLYTFNHLRNQKNQEIRYTYV
ncbi:unnamed protein product (macronuclear) [Paramecium tetraurelia]|uniref:Uncharacterized protein n=1 Tax=Paramecium tetraurelia TaxID=5888 RepID=A0C2W6_PARTE|nr:uncharacterized protein GSPATT00034611001 [Paramecium tetraurelia]CAK65133.1 unnamed protein product [Paramecium tetraurelia]|eukprot:XP_001432530.1 hypothetical protein (macronuclear) [Paramecium tetraurelia strain d4-2]